MRAYAEETNRLNRERRAQIQFPLLGQLTRFWRGLAPRFDQGLYGKVIRIGTRSTVTASIKRLPSARPSCRRRQSPIATRS